MEITYDENLDCPTYKLSKVETEELEQTGFVQDDKNGVVITKIDKQYTVALITKEKESIILNY